MKIGVLGYGSIGQRHAKNLETLGCKVATYDPALPGHASGRDWLIDWADAMVISSPTSEHWSDIAHGNRRNMPMFVEKPIGHMACDLSTANVKMVGYNLRFHSCVKKAHRWLEKGRIGQPLWATFNCAQFNDKPQYLRDGVILNWSHEIDLALHLLGPANVVSCVTTSSEDMADIILRSRNAADCQTTIHLDYVTKPERRGFTIGSSNGYIAVDLVKRQAFLRGPNGEDEVFNGQDSFDENYLDEMRAFLMRLDGQPTIGCTVQEGLDVLNICLKAKEMAR